MDFDPSRKLTREGLSSLPPLCTDGAWGTELLKLGGDPDDLKDTWNLTAPERVLEVACSYVEAGSSIILTNTFSANRIVMESHGKGDHVWEVSKAGAGISKRAAARRAFVFGSVGPTGRMVSLGELSAGQAEEVFAEQAAALAEGGADAIVVETQTDPEEARAALRGALKASELPVGVTFTFDSGKDHTRTLMGTTVAEAHEIARAGGASFVGANCGVGIESYVTVAKLFAECGGDLPIWIKGNAGRPELTADGQPVYPATPEVFATATRELVAAGARFIGGCCGSTPEHIRAVARTLQETVC